MTSAELNAHNEPREILHRGRKNDRPSARLTEPIVSAKDSHLSVFREGGRERNHSQTSPKWQNRSVRRNVLSTDLLSISGAGART